MVSKNPEETPKQAVSRKRASWRNKSGQGFELNEQENGSVDFVLKQRNKPVAHLNLKKDMVDALKKKLEGF